MSKNPKSELALQCQERGLGEPDYRTRSSGPAHEPAFATEVWVSGILQGQGEGKTKKQAERVAAEAALVSLSRVTPALNVSPEFGGPWPVFPELLAACLTVANSRIEVHAKTEDALGTVQASALVLYKGLLLELGELVEEDA